MKYGLDGNMNGKIEIVMRKVGLDPVSKKRVCNYSLGMRQRLAIAQAIMEDQPILILNEPMNGLDECGKSGQAEDWRWIYRNYGWEWVSVWRIEQSNVLVLLYALLFKRVVLFKKVHFCSELCEMLFLTKLQRKDEAHFDRENAIDSAHVLE